MTKTIAIARRELGAIFYSPIAYVVLGLMALGAGLLFIGFTFGPGYPASTRSTFSGMVWLMVFLAPAVSMRLLSEEYRSGSIEPLMTAPLSDTQVVLGKWLGAMGFLATLLIPLLIIVGVMELTASPDYGPILTGLLGLLLVGGLYLAIGAFASAVTANQIIAFLLTIIIINLFTLLLQYLASAPFVTAAWQDALLYANVNWQFETFNKGLIDVRGLIYFTSGTALFLFLAVKLVESRRWR